MIQRLNNFYNPFLRFRYPYYNYNHIPPKVYNSTSNGFNYQTKTGISEPKKISTDIPIFEFKGIKLFSDDLLILLLIFFFHKEGTDDLLLYVILFALLFA